MKKFLTADGILGQLEEEQVTLQNAVDVVLMPPEDGELTDEDSKDDEELLPKDPNHFFCLFVSDEFVSEHWKKRHSLPREKEDQERQDKEDQERQDKEDQERQDKEDQESGLGQSRDKRRVEKKRAEQQAAGEKRKQEQSHQEAKVRRLEEKKKEEISLLDFTREVVEFMLEKHGRGLETSATPRLSKAGQEVMRYDNIGHLIILSNPTINGRCTHCSGRSRYRCKKCNVALHPDCFYDYHVKS